MKKGMVQGMMAVLISPFVLINGMSFAWTMPATAATPATTAPEDIPEEVLQTQIILDARSPIDGRPMTPAEYAEWQAIAQAEYAPPVELSPKVTNLIKLLKLRRFIKRYLPIIPIK